MTFRLTPSEAMMKANSPICVRLNPHCMAVFSGCPESRTPAVPKMVCPSSTASTMARIGNLYSTIMAGSTIIPTDTKKMAPNRSLTGATSLSMCSDSTVSANMDPMIKAPNAGEKPTLAASTTIPKQRPRDMMSRVSLFISLRMRFRKSGIR